MVMKVIQKVKTLVTHKIKFLMTKQVKVDAVSSTQSIVNQLEIINVNSENH